MLKAGIIGPTKVAPCPAGCSIGGGAARHHRGDGRGEAREEAGAGHATCGGMGDMDF